MVLDEASALTDQRCWSAGYVHQSAKYLGVGRRDARVEEIPERRNQAFHYKYFAISSQGNGRNLWGKSIGKGLGWEVYICLSQIEHLQQGSFWASGHYIFLLRGISFEELTRRNTKSQNNGAYFSLPISFFNVIHLKKEVVSHKPD